MTLFLIGGGPSQAVATAVDEFVSAARSRGNRIAIALLGSAEEAAGFLDAYADPITSRYPEALIEPI